MTLYNRSNARRSLFDTISLRLVSQAATLTGYVVLVRGISVADFGLYSLLYAFIPVVGTIASFGLAQVLSRYQPEYLRSGNIKAAAWLVRAVSAGRVLSNILVLGAILIGWKYVAPIFHLTPHKLIFAGFSILILLHFQTAIMQIALGSHMLHRFAIGSTTALALIKLILYCALSFTGKLSLDTAILTDTLAYAVAYLFMHIAYSRYCLPAEARDSYRAEPEERKKLIRYGLLNNFDDMGVLLMYSTLDNFFLAAFLNTTAVGIYSFYSRLKEMVYNLLPAHLFANIVQPMFFSVGHDEAAQKIPVYFSFLINTGLLLQWPAFAFAVSYHAELVNVVFGGKFVEYSWLLPVIMSFGLLNTMSEPVYLVAQYRERVGVVLLSKIFVVYNIIAMALLVPTMGVYGAALAAGSAQVMKNLFIWWYVRDTALWINSRAALTTGFTLWGITTCVCLALKRILGAPPLANLIIGVFVIGMAVMLHIRTKAIAQSDRDILLSILPARSIPLMKRLGLLNTYS